MPSISEIDRDISFRRLSLQVGAPNFSHWTAKIAQQALAAKAGIKMKATCRANSLALVE